MSKKDNSIEMEVVKAVVEPVIEKNELIGRDQIGLRLKGASDGKMVTIHNSMRKHFSTDKWDIIEPKESKKK
jgi:hypothetical protein